MEICAKADACVEFQDNCPTGDESTSEGGLVSATVFINKAEVVTGPMATSKRQARKLASKAALEAIRASPAILGAHTANNRQL
eukprot:scaffold95610_cov48-Prasinocladus_malaysianus.AAC.1